MNNRLKSTIIVFLGALGVLSFFYPIFLGYNALPIPLFQKYDVSGIFGKSDPKLEEKWIGLSIKGRSGLSNKTIDPASIMMFYPSSFFAIDEIKKGRLPLWNPYNGCGTPILEYSHLNIINPFKIPFYTYPNPLTFTISMFMLVMFSFFGMVIYASKKIDNPYIWVLCGWIYSLNNLFLDRFMLTDISAMAFFPWIILSIDKFINKPSLKQTMIISIWITFMTICGHPEVSLLIAIISYLYLTEFAIREMVIKKSKTSKLLKGIILLPLLTFLLSFFLIYPYIYLWNESFTYKSVFNAWGNINSIDFIHPLSNLFLYPWIAGGIIMFLFYKPLKYIYTLISAFLGMSFLFSIFPFRFIHTILAKSHITYYYGKNILFISLSMMAIHAIIEWAKQNYKTKSIAIVFVIFYSGYCIYSIFIFKELWYDLSIFLLGSITFSVAILKGKISNKIAILILFIEILSGFLWSKEIIPYWNKSDIKESALIREINNLDKDKRFAGKTIGAPIIPPNLSAILHIRDVRIVDTIFTKRYHKYFEYAFLSKSHFFPNFLTLGSRIDPFASWSSFNYLITNNDNKVTIVTMGKIIPGINLSESHSRFYIANKLSIFENLDSALKVMSSHKEDLVWQELTILESNKVPSYILNSTYKLTGKGSITILKDEPSMLNLRVDIDNPGLLVISDTFSESWECKVNSNISPIVPVNIAFRGVFLQKGENNIKMYYSARKYFTGIGISFLSALIMLYIIERDMKNNKSRYIYQ